MSDVKWTKEQEQAIHEKASNILVAAAAGSGKTAVLVERIIQKVINENIDIDKLLVVTFTNAAASEMRERVLNAIYEKIDKDPENEMLHRQVTLLNKAKICTIDSFCLDVVRNNFYVLDNLSPNFRIADNAEIELLKQDTIEEIFENKYEGQDEDFDKLIHTYTGYRDDTPLKDLVLKIYTYIQSNPFPDKWLKDKVEMFNIEKCTNFSETPWGKELVKELNEELENAIYSLKDVEKRLSVEPELEKCYLVINDDIDKFENLQKNLQNWDNAYQINSELSFLSWPKKSSTLELKEEAKGIRNNIKKKTVESLNTTLICNSEEAYQDIKDMYDVLVKLEDLVIEFEHEFSNKKRERNIVDFHDIEHFALQILIEEKDGKPVPTEIAKKYQKKFVEIAIDEYQDSNLVQEYILNSVSTGNNIFMVGDVKQSIYKFRQAMPELFINKYNTYKLKSGKEENDNLKIQLFKNFRSRKNILNFTNMIFQNIMSENLGDINYNNEEYLNLGADYSEIDNQNTNIEIHIIDLADEEENMEIDSQDEIIEDSEIEAKFVANKIKELVESKYQVWDKNEKKYRDITYKDIVILLRSTSSLAPIYEQELIDLEIPTFSDSSQEYLNSIEIQTIMSVLKIIDNPMQDIPLVTVLRSHIGKFTDNDLIEIRLADKYDNFYTCMEKAVINADEKLKNKINRIFDFLNMWRKEKEYLALDELIWKIYTDTGYYNYVGLMPNGELRQANLKMLFQKAKQYESSNFKGLYNFINFIDKVKLSSGDMGAAKIIGENDNVVRIMSIHKSKGLEFPVVFLSSTNKQFNFKDLYADVLLHQDLGIGVRYIDYNKQVQYNTLTKLAIKNKMLTEILSEEMRILYVALTRAKEKLFITALNKDYNKNIDEIKKNIDIYKRENDKINPILLKKYKKYIDWILLVYEYENEYNSEKINDLVDLKVHKKSDILKDIINNETNDIDVIKILEEKSKDDSDLKSRNGNVSFKNTKNDDNENINTDNIKNIDKILNYQYPYLLDTKIPTKTSVTALKSSNTMEKVSLSKPKFLSTEKEEKITPAKKGTLVHLCLQKLDTKKEYDLDELKKLVQDLEYKKIITEKEAQSIELDKILNFTKSNIWEELKQAKEIQKEKPFYIDIPAEKIYNEPTKENILVQGVIDLYYIDKNDKIKLVDYKTDYVQSNEEYKLIDRYKNQLDLYAVALEEVYGRKVDKKYIYSIYLGKGIEL